MARPANLQPTDVELEILAILWKSGPLELGPLCQAIRQQRPIATTTVATMLGVMIQKGLARRAKGERGWRYSAARSREQTAAGLVQKLVERAFEGSAPLLVSHLLDHGQLTAEERQQILDLLSADDAKKPARRAKR
jgi:predicted transcriptional regulator